MGKIFYFCVLAAFVSFSYGDNEAVIEVQPTVTDNAKMRSEVLKSIFHDYDKLNIPDNPNVKFGLAVRNIYVDEEKQTLEADVWMRMVWSDDRLKWNSESTDVTVLRVGSEEIWQPDMTLYNSANPGEKVSCGKSMALIYPNGEVLRVPPCHISVYCNLTLEVHPWREQTCKFKFGSWVYDSLTMNLDFYNNLKGIDTDDYVGNKWEITNTTATRKDTYYPCCKEPYTTLNFNLSFKRNTNRNVCNRD